MLQGHLRSGAKVVVVLVSDSPLLREALLSCLTHFPDLEVMAGDHPCKPAAPGANGNVVLIEALTGARDSISLTQSILARDLAARIIVLTVSATPWHVGVRLLRAGAKGLLFTDVGTAEMAKALRRVASGHLYLPPDLERILAERHLSGQDLIPEEMLTQREFQVMTALAHGRTNREVARELHLSIKTVDSHRATLLRKLGLRNNSDLTRFAIERALG